MKQLPNLRYGKMLIYDNYRKTKIDYSHRRGGKRRNMIKICPCCGKKMPENVRVCTECGTDYEAYAQSVVGAARASSSNHGNTSNRKRICIVIACLVLLVVGMIALIVFIPRITGTGEEIENSKNIVTTEDPSDVPSDETQITPEMNDETQFDSQGALGNAEELSSISNEEQEVAANDEKPSEAETEAEGASEDFAMEQIVGVYHGNASDMLVIDANGYATYYCASQAYSEPMCPWTYQDGRLEIYMSKFHTMMWAKINEDEELEQIVLQGDTISWDDEVFRKLSADPEDLADRAILAEDSKVTVNADGTMSATFDGMRFTVPKWYVNHDSKLDHAVMFVDQDMDEVAMADLLILCDDNTYSSYMNVDRFGEYAAWFMERFLDDCVIGETAEMNIGKHTAYSCTFSGHFNSGFGGVSGYSIGGKLVTIVREDTGHVINAAVYETTNGDLNDIAAFDEMMANIIL